MSRWKVDDNFRALVRQEYAKCKCVSEVAKEFGVARSTIHNILKDASITVVQEPSSMRRPNAFGRGDNDMGSIQGTRRSLNPDGTRKPAHVIAKAHRDEKIKEVADCLVVTKTRVEIEKGVCYCCGTTDGLIRRDGAVFKECPVCRK